MTDKPLILADWAARLPPPRIEDFDFEAIDNELMRGYVPQPISHWRIFRYMIADGLRWLADKVEG